MLTIRINAITREQTVIRDEPTPADKPAKALASILAEWMMERTHQKEEVRHCGKQ